MFFQKKCFAFYADRTLRYVLAFLMLTLNFRYPTLSFADDPSPGPVSPVFSKIQGEPAGYLAGGFSVNEGGSASYSIPLSLPPGTNNMRPNFSLLYDSRGSNTLVGSGWSLSGLSTLSRCSSTIAQDGGIRGVEFDADDKFCLDGQRLVAVSGTYGANGTEYRTENESFSQIFSYGLSGAGPERWLVKTRDGLTYEYGYTGDSRVEAQGRLDILYWHVNKVQDNAGNYFSVLYHEDSARGESYPLEVQYTGNSSENLSPYNSVKFEYETRPDVLSSYVSGSQVINTKRLKKIATYTDSDLAWEYKLTYSQSAIHGFSRLASVTECGESGACLEPTTFLWDEGSTQFGSQQLWWSASNRSTFQSQPRWVNNSNNSFYSQLLDLTGDGRPDRLSAVHSSTGQYGLWVASNTGNGFSAEQNWWPQGSSGDQHMPLSRDDDGIRFALIDMDADGLSDRVGYFEYQSNEYGLWVSKNNGSGFDTAVKWWTPSYNASGNSRPLWISDGSGSIYVQLLDMDGDGRLDRVASRDNVNNQKGLWVAINNGQGFGVEKNWWTLGTVGEQYLPQVQDEDDITFTLRDMNGDGLPDRLAHYNYQTSEYGLWIYLNNGSGFDSPTNWWPYGTTGDLHRPERADEHGQIATLLDMNGDGLPDRVQYHNYATNTPGVTVRLNNGAGFEPEVTWLKTPTNDAGRPYWVSDGNPERVYAQLLDLTADGLPDRLISVNYANATNGLWVYANNGAGFDAPENWWPHGTVGDQHLPESGTNNGLTFTQQDMNGDGLLDRVGYYNYQSSQYGLWVSLNNGRPSLLTAIANGHGAVTSIKYRALTDDSVYTKDNDASYPARDVQAPLYVVSSYETDDGIGGRARTTYEYEGLKIGMRGRGFCGFRQITSVDETSGIRNTTFYRQDHPFKSMPFKTEVRLSDGTLQERTIDKWQVENFPAGNYFIYVSESILEEYDLDGTPLNVMRSEKSYDSFGNLKKLTTIDGDGRTVTTDNAYSNDINRWILGRLTRAEALKQTPGEVSIKNVASFRYDNATGFLIEETTEPDSSTLWSKKTLVRDGFGNITQSTVSGAGVSPVAQFTTYDDRGQFAVVSKNALQHVETKTYDKRHGLVTSLTGPNGITTDWLYDDFGRTVYELRANGVETRTLRMFVSGAGAPKNAVYYERTDKSGSAPNIKYFDILDREIRIESVGFHGQRIFVDKVYNSRGELERESEPYFASDTPLWHVHKYDQIGRLIKTTAPGNRVTTTDYQGYTTRVTNPLSQTALQLRNSRGELLESKDNAGKSLRYFYDSNGNLRKTEDPAGNITRVYYDLLGNKTRVEDPDLGIITYRYNSLGRLIHQTDAKQNTTSFTYDLLGRKITRTEPEGVTTWTYDTASNGVGKLAQVISPPGVLESYQYDQLGRMNQISLSVGGLQYRGTKNYDQYGRPLTLTYPSGFTVQNRYNFYGYHEAVFNAQSKEVYWQAKDIDARGQLLLTELGNGLRTRRTFNPVTNFLEDIQTPGVQDLSFAFDAIGNLAARSDNALRLREDFRYDKLNRLVRTEVVGGAVTTVAYDALGNITSMSNVGSYTYGENGAGPHAVTSISGPQSNTFRYDANGNRTGDVSGTVRYSSFNKPTRIQKGNASLEFFYGADRSRFAQVINDGSSSPTIKVYFGKDFEQEISESSIKETHYIRAGGSVVAAHVTETGQASKLRYLHRDHLGSIQSISDENGQVLEVLSFDAWGNRRNPDWTPVNQPIQSQMNRGFTGHEQLDAVGLIHMNGRVYDPAIGRFLSADPHIQTPENLQSANRYSYVLNNPLSYTDPSGFFFKKLFKSIFKFLKKHKSIVIGVAIGLASAGWASGLGFNIIASASVYGPITPIQSMLANAIGASITGGLSSAAVTAANGGSVSDILKDGLVGGVSAGVIAGASQALNRYFKALKQDPYASRGPTSHKNEDFVSKAVSGGKLEHNIISGEAGEDILLSGEDALLAESKLVIRETAGRSVSEAAGTNFANGATTNSFSGLYKTRNPLLEKSVVAVKPLEQGLQNMNLAETISSSASEYFTLPIGKDTKFGIDVLMSQAPRFDKVPYVNTGLTKFGNFFNAYSVLDSSARLLSQRSVSNGADVFYSTFALLGGTVGQAAAVGYLGGQVLGIGAGSIYGIWTGNSPEQVLEDALLTIRQ